MRSTRRGAAPLTRWGLARLAEREGLRRLRPGIVLLGQDAPVLPGLLAAAELTFGDVLVTGPAGCREHGLRDVPEDERLHVLVRHGVQRVPPDGVVPLRVRVWPEDCGVPGLPLAPLTRAVEDACRGRDLRTTRALVTRAHADGRLSREDLQEWLDRHPQPWTGNLRRAARDALLGSESAPECEAAELFVRPGVTVHRNCTLLDADGRRVRRVDLHAFGTGLVQEVDSEKYHGGALLEPTLDRHAELVEAGYEVLHGTPTGIRTRPGVLRRRWDTVLDRREEHGLGDPPGACRLVDGTVVPHLPPRPAGPAPARRRARASARRTVRRG